MMLARIVLRLGAAHHTVVTPLPVLTHPVRPAQLAIHPQPAVRAPAPLAREWPLAVLAVLPWISKHSRFFFI